MKLSVVLYLLGRRAFVFLDEWLTYLLLIWLYRRKQYKLLGIILPFAIIFNINGYIGLWSLLRSYNIEEHGLERMI